MGACGGVVLGLCGTSELIAFSLLYLQSWAWLSAEPCIPASSQQAQTPGQTIPTPLNNLTKTNHVSLQDGPGAAYVRGKQCIFTAPFRLQIAEYLQVKRTLQ